MIEIVSARDPLQLPWKKLGVQLVIEGTGVFIDTPGATKHITAGASKAGPRPAPSPLLRFPHCFLMLHLYTLAVSSSAWPLVPGLFAHNAPIYARKMLTLSCKGDDCLFHVRYLGICLR